MRRALIILALGGLATPGAAQVSLQPRLGVILADMKDADADLSTRGRLGYQAGVDLRIGLGVFAQPGIHYQQVALEQTTLVGSFEFDIRSLHFPALVGVRVGTGPAGVRIAGGPSLTLVQSVPANEGGVTKAQLNRELWGGMLGAGVDLGSVAVDLTGELGLTRLFADGFDGKLRTVRLTAGLRF